MIICKHAYHIILSRASKIIVNLWIIVHCMQILNCSKNTGQDLNTYDLLAFKICLLRQMVSLGSFNTRLKPKTRMLEQNLLQAEAKAARN